MRPQAKSNESLPRRRVRAPHQVQQLPICDCLAQACQSAILLSQELACVTWAQAVRLFLLAFAQDSGLDDAWTRQLRFMHNRLIILEAIVCFGAG